MTRSLRSSSTTRARGAGITILLLSLSTLRLLRPPLPATLLPSPPQLLQVCPLSRGSVGQHSSPGSKSGSHPTPTPPPLPERGARWCLKTAPVALLAKRMIVHKKKLEKQYREAQQSSGSAELQVRRKQKS